MFEDDVNAVYEKSKVPQNGVQVQYFENWTPVAGLFSQVKFAKLEHHRKQVLLPITSSEQKRRCSHFNILKNPKITEPIDSIGDY
jgi:hypothetical protein